MHHVFLSFVVSNDSILNSNKSQITTIYSVMSKAQKKSTSGPIAEGTSNIQDLGKRVVNKPKKWDDFIPI